MQKITGLKRKLPTSSRLEFKVSSASKYKSLVLPIYVICEALAAHNIRALDSAFRSVYSDCRGLFPEWQELKTSADYLVRLADKHSVQWIKRFLATAAQDATAANGMGGGGESVWSLNTDHLDEKLIANRNAALIAGLSDPVIRNDELLATEITLRPGTRELINTLKTNGWKIGVVSVWSRDVTRACLEHLGIASIVNTIVNANALMSVRMPYSGLYDEVSHRLHMHPRDCLLVAQLPIDVLDAYTNQFTSILLPHRSTEHVSFLSPHFRLPLPADPENHWTELLRILLTKGQPALATPLLFRGALVGSRCQVIRDYWNHPTGVVYKLVSRPRIPARKVKRAVGTAVSYKHRKLAKLKAKNEAKAREHERKEPFGTIIARLDTELRLESIDEPITKLKLPSHRFIVLLAPPPQAEEQPAVVPNAT